LQVIFYLKCYNYAFYITILYYFIIDSFIIIIIIIIIIILLKSSNSNKSSDPFDYEKDYGISSNFSWLYPL